MSERAVTEIPLTSAVPYDAADEAVAPANDNSAMSGVVLGIYEASRHVETAARLRELLRSDDVDRDLIETLIEALLSDAFRILLKGRSDLAAVHEELAQTAAATG